MDRTGLAGKFDFNLEFAPDLPAGGKLGPSFEQALREQFGFRLESQRGAIPAERLTDN